MGATTTRFFSVTSRREIGSNSIGPGMRILQSVRVYGTPRPIGRTSQRPRASAIVRAKEPRMDARVNDTAAIDSAIDAALADKRIVGGVVLVRQDGELVYRRAAGLADRERNVPMREDAVFRLASLTKPLVTAAALHMVELGKIALADPVTRYLPDFRPALPSDEVLVITLRHLLTHTAGLAYRFMQPDGGAYERAGVSDGADEPGRSMDENLKRIARAGLFYRPGEKWEYSVAMDVLGAVLQMVEGEDLEAIVKKYVSTPLGAPRPSRPTLRGRRAGAGAHPG